MGEGNEEDTRTKGPKMSDENRQQRKERKRDDAWSCCGTGDWMTGCSPDANRMGAFGWRAEGMPSFMRNCSSMCRYFPLVPVIMGAGFLALGYFLSPESVRVLWMVGAGIAVVMGLFGLVVVGRIASRIGSVRR